MFICTAAAYKLIEENTLYFRILKKSKLPICFFLWSSFHHTPWIHARGKNFYEIYWCIQWIISYAKIFPTLSFMFVQSFEASIYLSIYLLPSEFGCKFWEPCASQDVNIITGWFWACFYDLLPKIMISS
jgi:hypothetical protein